MTQNTIAVFIDSENINPADYKYIDSEIKNTGRIIISNIYGDWNDPNIKNWISVAKEYGIQKIQVDKLLGLKNSVDHKICVHIMKYLYTNHHIDIYYIISSDSDFRHVIYEIKEHNKKVYGIGNSPLTSYLVPVCNNYIRIVDLRQTDKTSKFNIIKSNIKEIYNLKTVNQENIDKYRNTIKKYMIPNKIYNLSYINDFLRRIYPTFNHRNYKTETFKEFIIKYYSEIIEIRSYENKGTALVKLK